MSQFRLLDRNAWRDPAAFDRWQRGAWARGAAMSQATGRRSMPSFGRWLDQVSPRWPWHYEHLKIMRRHLKRVERGEVTRLMIFLHPRSFKSQMVTVRYPAYLLERDPMTRVIVASYNQSLAESFSHATRAIVTERGVAMDPSRQMVDEWLTAAGGGVKAVGVGSGVTGRGANCFPGETPILTERGYIPIGELHRMEHPPRVVSLDEGVHTPNICALISSRESEAYELVEITTRAGRRIRCTPDHRLYTHQSGYKEAGLLREGDELLAYDLPDLWREEVESGGERRLLRQGAARAWDAVAGIRRLRTTGVKVYDLQVDRSHNFLAGGVLAHNCILIDDPVRSYAEAHSRAYRERVWNWWQSDLVTRLEPHPRTGRPAAVILTMTRWNEDDLAGRLLSGPTGHEWTVLRIPALAETQAERDSYNASIGRPAGEADPLGREPGEAMNPERFDAQALALRRDEQGLMAFMSLYQQRPSAPEGDMFRREWFEVLDDLPAGKSRALVRYWDKAGSEGGTAYTAGVLLALVDGLYYVVHMVMGKWGAAERERVIRQTAASDFAAYGHDVETVVEQEPGSGGKESAENTIRSLEGYRVAADRPTGDKALRAEPLAAQAAVGRVKLIAGPWNRDYLDILAAFPGGAVKDAVDASSDAFARLTRVTAARPAAGAPIVARGEDIFGA